MAGVLAALLWAALVGATSGQSLDTGVPGCSCVDPWAPVRGSLESLPQYDAVNNCVNGTDGFCYPVGYGGGECRAWDDNLPPPCRAPPEFGPKPAYCTSDWCYVDPTACSAPSAPTAVFEGIPGLGGGETGFHYSYETCGFLNDYSSGSVLAAVRGKTLRVAYLDDRPPLLATRGGVRSGSWPAFAARVLEELGISVVVSDISADSRERVPLSSAGACAHDVGLGRVDLCVGPVWPSPDLRQMPNVGFSSEVSRDDLVVVARRSASATGVAEIAAPFQPFSPGLWASLAGVTFVSAIVYLVLEDDSMLKEQIDSLAAGLGRPDGLGRRSSQSGRASRQASQNGQTDVSIRGVSRRPSMVDRIVSNIRNKAAEEEGSEEEEEYEEEVPFLEKAAESIYIGSMSFVNRAMGYVPITFSGRLLNFGLGFMFLFAVSAYTASLARGFLLRSTVTGEVASLDEGLAQGLRVCGWEEMRGELSERYPVLAGSTYVGTSDSTQAVNGMDEGRCDLAIVGRVDWDYLTRFEQTLPDGRQVTHCRDKVVLGEPVTSLSNTFAISLEFERGLSWAFVKNRAIYFDEFDAFVSALPPVRCKPERTGTDEALTLADTAGLFLFIGMAFLVATLLWLWRLVSDVMYRRRLRREAREFVRVHLKGFATEEEAEQLEGMWVGINMNIRALRQKDVLDEGPPQTLAQLVGLEEPAGGAGKPDVEAGDAAGSAMGPLKGLAKFRAAAKKVMSANESMMLIRKFAKEQAGQARGRLAAAAAVGGVHGARPRADLGTAAFMARRPSALMSQGPSMDRGLGRMPSMAPRPSVAPRSMGRRPSGVRRPSGSGRFLDGPQRGHEISGAIDPAREITTIPESEQ